MCIIEFLTGYGCVLVNLLQCDSRKGLPFPVFFALPQNIFGFLHRVHNSCLAIDANGAFVSIKIVFSSIFPVLKTLQKMLKKSVKTAQHKFSYRVVKVSILEVGN